jgi:hypothetical protein
MRWGLFVRPAGAQCIQIYTIQAIEVHNWALAEVF